MTFDRPSLSFTATYRLLKGTAIDLQANTPNAGSGVPKPSPKTAHLPSNWLIRPPTPACTQRAIAHILGTLDDKIELNRRMSETLEAMARAIFQDWFVDFGPVRAKLEGREPYLPPELWSLFPNRLVDSELGEIPEGWEVKALGDICQKPQYGYTHRQAMNMSVPSFSESLTSTRRRGLNGRQCRTVKSPMKIGVSIACAMAISSLRVWRTQDMDAW